MSLLANTRLTIRRRGGDLEFPALQLAAADRVLLLGPSGCGKTTWLSVMGGLLPPDTGSVSFQGTDIYSLPSPRRDRWRGRHCGFVFQGIHLLPALTVRQNIALAASLAGLPIDEGRIGMLLETLRLSDKAGRKPASLSHGEQQRAAVARAVINRPDIIFADEPTSALDDTQAQTVIDMLIDCANQDGTALVVATHDHRISGHFANKVMIPASQRTAA